MSITMICVLVLLVLSIGVKVLRIRKGGSFFWMSKSKEND